jgi:hypothetical protein
MDHNSDREEIDLLVSELTAKRTAPKAAAPHANQPLARSSPAHAYDPFAPDLAGPRPGSRWTNVRVLMPSRRRPGLERFFAFRPAISLPPLPDLSHYFRMPGPVTMVRLWVGLGAVYSASMTFWPYPKTYLWGSVLYILSLALVLVTGIWGARLSWDARLGAAHTVALGTALWAVTLAAAETLPPI